MHQSNKSFVGGGQTLPVRCNLGKHRTSLDLQTWKLEVAVILEVSFQVFIKTVPHLQIFIDRDPAAFAPILNFLRTKELDLR